MSLDVHLTLKGSENHHKGSGIFVRENGETKEITRDEWDEKFPGREPFTVEIQSDGETVYTANITHNLGKMAEEAGIYGYLWRPNEIGITRAEQLIKPLSIGLALLKSDPERFKKFDAKNGWGLYIHFVPFVEKYLQACKEYPDAEVSVGR